MITKPKRLLSYWKKKKRKPTEKGKTTSSLKKPVFSALGLLFMFRNIK